jgi:MFS transporter, SHS family, lactate transporter
MTQVGSGLPWYRQVNKEQWKAFLATFLGWVLDGFDFTILTFVLLDIQKSFTVDSALAGALGTVTLLFRLVGGVAAGTMADKYGRKLPLMLSILWFSIFACLSGFSTSYAMLFAFRALFGIGMGGEWAAGMPLALEHWPAHLRGIASGLLQGGYSWGFILSAITFQYVYPLFRGNSDIGWRVMFWMGVLPALLVLWIRSGVSESPVWLARQKHLRETHRKDHMSMVRIFRKDLLGVTIQSSLLLGAFMFSYYAISFWYPTLLRETGLEPIRYLMALNLGGIAGAAFWGRMSETRLGRRGSATAASLLAIVLIPVYLSVNWPLLAVLAAFLMGVGGPGMWGIIPTYLTERFPTSARGVGPGFAYHAGAGLGSITPTLIGALKDRGLTLPVAMGSLIAASCSAAILLLWLGPETRGSEFVAVDEHEKERDKSEVEVAASQEPDLKEAGLEEAAIDTR